MLLKEKLGVSTVLPTTPYCLSFENGEEYTLSNSYLLLSSFGKKKEEAMSKDIYKQKVSGARVQSRGECFLGFRGN